MITRFCTTMIIDMVLKDWKDGVFMAKTTWKGTEPKTHICQIVSIQNKREQFSHTGYCNVYLRDVEDNTIDGYVVSALSAFLVFDKEAAEKHSKLLKIKWYEKEV